MPDPTRSPTGWHARLERRMDAYARRRHGYANGPLTLDRRRIYILPTSFGLLWAACLCALYVGALNFGSNLTHALVFLLLAIALLDMHDTHRQIAGLEVSAQAGAPVFQGESAHFSVRLAESRGLARPALLARFGPDGGAGRVALPARGTVDISLPCAAVRRGWRTMDGLRIETRYPLGLFRAWGWLGFERAVLVYPRPLPPPHSLFGRDAGQEAAPVTPPSAADDSELSHLRDYQRGDPPRRIAWKAMARSQRLLTKQFATPAASNVWLDWDALPHSDDETRLSWLCGAVLELERINRRYGLRLPSTLLAPATGAAHRDACLRALALFGLPARGAGA